MKFLDSWSPHLLALLRVVAGLMFMEHGCMKLLHFPAPMMPGALPPMLMVAGVIELVGGALIAVGLFAGIAAFIASGQMAVAYFMAHAPNGPWPIQNKGELAVLYCFLFLFIAARGSGSPSLDGLLRKRR